MIGAHTAHYSLGQGTKLALEDAIALADSLRTHVDIETALTAYEKQRKAELIRPLSEARCSSEWFEDLPRYLPLKPHQFAAVLETRWSPLIATHTPDSVTSFAKRQNDSPMLKRRAPSGWTRR